MLALITIGIFALIATVLLLACVVLYYKTDDEITVFAGVFLLLALVTLCGLAIDTAQKLDNLKPNVEVQQVQPVTTSIPVAPVKPTTPEQQ